MNGRKVFEKYSKEINLLVRFINVFPRNIRLKKLEKLRKKDGKISMLKRYILVKSLSKSCGNNVAIFPDVFFENIENLSIGNNVSIHQMCYIDAEGIIEIGNDVSIAHRTTILSSNHSYVDDKIAIKYQPMKLNKTVIGNNVWIGCSSIIMSGVTIGEGCVVGGGSVVTHNIEANSISVGNPANIIKKRIKSM